MFQDLRVDMVTGLMLMRFEGVSNGALKAVASKYA